jgi:hypothetical protein
LLFTLALSSNIFASVYNGPTDLSWRYFNDLVINGPAKLKLLKAATLQVNGPLQFNSIGIDGKAQVAGEFNGNKGQFGNLFVTGSMNVDHVLADNITITGPVVATYLEVKNDAIINGPLNAHHSEFNRLSVSSNNIVLDDVLVNEIIVNKNEKNQILILKGSTVVSGDITFESADGNVSIENSKVRIKGKVIGANTTKKY